MAENGPGEEAIIGMRPQDLLGEQVAAQILPHLERALEGHAQRFDVTMRDGTLLEAVYEPLPSSAGVLSRATSVFSRTASCTARRSSISAWRSSIARRSVRLSRSRRMIVRRRA